ncbi:exonuclease V, chloroplastic-like [Juglans microcarpa x Juglans regia]|uniref:exonuclease V, chloroplastic-like n=1 Tax=Juglans microcarpa x Juglans regia TaxID=2249226 RepID=UPI001B7EA957|nr:exonuclease V, chloroplastic-like [Juglans microcarpa x Juglans regia]
MKNHSRPSESFLELSGDTFCGNNNSCLDIPLELVSQEEMDLIDAALAAAHPSLTSSPAPAAPETRSLPQFRRDAKSSQTITLLSEMELIEASLTATRSSLTSSPAPATPETSSSRQFRRNSKPSQSITSLPEMELVSEEEMCLIEASLAATRSSLTYSPAPATPETSSSRQFRRNLKSSRSITSLSEMELVREEERDLIDAAIAATPHSLTSSVAPAASSPSLFQRKAKSIQSITSLSKRRLSFGAESDIEDSCSLGRNQKKSREAESFLRRFRSKTGLFVSDITATEWCEKQMEFILLFGSRKITEAMKIGRARHAKLEEEVVKKVEVQVNSAEDEWAVRLTKFIIGANQLLTEGLTRELPLIGLVEGVWMVGVIDEVRMPVTESDRNPIFVDTKTRVKNALPFEPQKRKGRLQLMCYKYLWDNLVTDEFPSNRFFNFFSLNPYSILSEEIRENTAKSGFPAKILDDMVTYYRHKCSMLSPAHDQLLVRYELQKDNKLIGEDLFAYDSDWLKSQIHCCLEFWRGEREANCTPPEERWKCRFCQFDIVCPTITNPDSASSPTKANLNSSLS